MNPMIKKMTREKAIKLLTQYIDYDAETPDYYEMEKACRVAIKALEQKPILDQIETEIQKLRGCSCNYSDGIIDDVEDIIGKYRK